MNDETEIVYAYNEIIGPIARTRVNGEPKYFIKNIKSDLVRHVWGRFCTHIACFSRSSELRSQWERYAKWTGFAIGFNRSQLTQWCLERGIPIFPVSYNRTLHEHMIRRFFEREAVIESQRNCGTDGPVRETLRGKAIDYLSSLASTLKEAGWKDEQEWRILVIQTEGNTRFECLTRGDNICYFELPICTPDFVTEVIFRPGSTADDNGLRRLLDTTGFSGTAIRGTPKLTG
jgi:hypothetical protein